MVDLPGIPASTAALSGRARIHGDGHGGPPAAGESADKPIRGEAWHGDDAGEVVVELDPAQIALFTDMVFGYCEGLIPLRGLPEQGRTETSGLDLDWHAADHGAAAAVTAFARRAAAAGRAAFVIPGTVAARGQGRAEDVRQMQAVVVDLDAGDMAAALAHLIRHLGQPSMLVESGGRTDDGEPKLHVWWKLTEAAAGEDVAEVCRLRDLIARKVGGDRHFGSAHQPIRVAGSVYGKNGAHRLVRIREHHDVEYDLAEFAERVAGMPPLPGIETPDDGQAGNAPLNAVKPGIDAVLTTPVREGGLDDWSRFQGASATIGHYVRMVHDGRMAWEEAWEAVCGYNAACLQPPWPLERLQGEMRRLWNLHCRKHGPSKEASSTSSPAPVSPLPVFRLGVLLDDRSPLPPDLIAPRLLTQGGLLVLGGAPKVGKSDFLLSLLVHMAAGEPFLGFRPERPLRVFYLQAEIQYHYLRERLQQVALPPEVIQRARHSFVATAKLSLLLDGDGVRRVAEAVNTAFPDDPADVLCIDPIRNVFDGGPDGGGENDNAAMLHFLQQRVEALRDAVNPDAGVILAHHTRKAAKKEVREDPFLSLSGASSLRGFYTSGLLLHRPDEDSSVRRLEIELRNGPGIAAKLIDKVQGRWVELDLRGVRLAGAEAGARHDAERLRKHDVILDTLFEEAAEGRLYTATQFTEAFENRAGLGSRYTIRDRLSVLTTKGYVKFLRDGTAFNHPKVRSRQGYLCVEAMRFGRDENVDPATGEVLELGYPVLPSHCKHATSGTILEVENPSVWVYPEGVDD